MWSWNYTTIDSPLIGINQMRPQGLWNDPCILQLNDSSYVMYLTTSVEQPFNPPVLPFRAVSSDGLSWNLSPNTQLLNATGTPFVSIETPSVVHYKGIWHMYYTGIYGDNSSMAIGHATSTDGIIWEHDSTKNPVISPTGKIFSWRSYLVAEPGAIIINDKIYVYFSAMSSRFRREGNYPPQKQVIGLAISNDGTYFSNYQVVLEQTELYSPSNGFVGYSTPSAVLYDNIIHLFHDVAYYNETANPSWRQVILTHAFSYDGIIFYQEPYSIGNCNSCAWTSTEIRSPSVIMIGDTPRMYFAGDGDMLSILLSLQIPHKIGTQFGIGYANGRSLSNFTKLMNQL